MAEENYDDTKDVKFHLELEGFNFYPEEEKEDQYFILYKLVLICANQDFEDLEFELLDQIKSELMDDDLLFTSLGEQSVTHRVIGLPEIEHLEFENGNFTLLENTNIIESLEFLKNMKTINFKDLKSLNSYDEKNFKSSIYKKDYNLFEIKKKITNNKKKIQSLLFESILDKLTNPKLALTKINDAIKLEIIDKKEDSYTYFYRAEIHIILNNNEKAIEDLRKVLELEPDFKRAEILLSSIIKKPH